jgi:hypothetical protein
LDDASRGRRRCDPANTYEDRDEILGHQFDKRLESFAPCYSTCGFYRKPYSTLVLKIHTKEIREKGNLESIHEKHFVERKNEGRKPDKNWRLRRLEFMPKNLD